jgi:hypothetical protein
MTEDAAKLIKKQSRRDRVTLDPVSLVRLNGWIDQLTREVRGLKINRVALVNFLISSHATELTPKEVGELKALFFDEIEYATWALHELKKARENGQKISLDEILKSAVPARRASPPRKPNTKKIGESVDAVTAEGSPNGTSND